MAARSAAACSACSPSSGSEPRCRIAVVDQVELAAHLRVNGADMVEVLASDSDDGIGRQGGQQVVGLQHRVAVGGGEGSVDGRPGVGPVPGLDALEPQRRVASGQPTPGDVGRQ